MSRELRRMSFADYGIDPHRKRELKAFCRQYDSKKNRAWYGTRGVNIDGMPHASGGGDPTAEQAIRNERWLKDCKLIEKAAHQATESCPVLYEAMLKSVTRGLSYEYLGMLPISKIDFYAAQRYFYHCLDLLQ